MLYKFDCDECPGKGTQQQFVGLETELLGFLAWFRLFHPLICAVLASPRHHYLRRAKCPAAHRENVHREVTLHPSPFTPKFRWTETVKLTSGMSLFPNSHIFNNNFLFFKITHKIHSDYSTGDPKFSLRPKIYLQSVKFETISVALARFSPDYTSQVLWN